MVNPTAVKTVEIVPAYQYPLPGPVLNIQYFSYVIYIMLNKRKCRM